MTPLAIDLFCGLVSGQAELRCRADFAIQKLVTGRAENPDHMSLRMGSQAPRPIAFEAWSVCYFKDAGFPAGFTCGWHVRIPAVESVKGRVLASARCFIASSSLGVLASGPYLSQSSRSEDGALRRAVPLIAVGRLDCKVLTALSAISAAFRRAFVLVAAYPPRSLRAVVAAPFFVWADSLKRRGALSAKQIIHERILA